MLKRERAEKKLHIFYHNEGLKKVSFGLGWKFKSDFVAKHTKHGVILDLGCAEGLYINFIRNFERIIIGLEISLPKLREAKELLKGGLLINASWSKLPFRKKIFRTTYWLDGIEHSLDPKQVLNEINQVTKSYLIITYPATTSILLIAEYLETTLNKLLLYVFGRPFRGHLHAITFNKFSHYLISTGFKILNHQNNIPRYTIWKEISLTIKAFFLKLSFLFGKPHQFTQTIYLSIYNLKVRKK